MLVELRQHRITARVNKGQRLQPGSDGSEGCSVLTCGTHADSKQILDSKSFRVGKEWLNEFIARSLNSFRSAVLASLTHPLISTCFRTLWYTCTWWLPQVQSISRLWSNWWMPTVLGRSWHHKLWYRVLHAPTLRSKLHYTCKSL